MNEADGWIFNGFNCCWKYINGKRFICKPHTNGISLHLEVELYTTELATRETLTECQELAHATVALWKGTE